MLGHLQRVLEQVADDADVRLSQLELLGEAEREQVLGTWNHTEREYSDPPAPRALRRVGAPRSGGRRPAGRPGGRDLRRAGPARAILARHLRELGVGPETPVGLCMERTPELLVGVLGIWKAGGAYVPLDPAYPAERLGWIISRRGAPGGGRHGEHGRRCCRSTAPPSCGWTQLPETARRMRRRRCRASDASLAYVIYTSGSTGRPKGVLVQHGSLSNLLAATREAFGVGEGDVMPALASYAFDIWLFEALLPLTSGRGGAPGGARAGAGRARAGGGDRGRHAGARRPRADAADGPGGARDAPAHAAAARLRGRRPGPGRPAGGDAGDALRGGDRTSSTAPPRGPSWPPRTRSRADGMVEGHPIGRPLGNVRLYVCDALGQPAAGGRPGRAADRRGGGGARLPGPRRR